LKNEVGQRMADDQAPQQRRAVYHGVDCSVTCYPFAAVSLNILDDITLSRLLVSS